MKDKSVSPRAKRRRPKGRHGQAAHGVAKATIKAVLGREMNQPPPQIHASAAVGNSWHGQRKKRRSTYSTPGQTADALWLDNKLAP